MGYADFTLTDVEARFGVRPNIAELFPSRPATSLPDWLPDQVARGRRQPLASEKARGELLVMPLLLAIPHVIDGEVSIFSGVKLDVDVASGLHGECDFVLARTPPLPVMRAPILAVVEAKKADIELGLGQCAAQMVAARRFNERAGGAAAGRIYGCVTSGEVWQFVRLDGTDLFLDLERPYITELPRILGILHAIASDPATGPAPGT